MSLKVTTEVPNKIRTIDEKTPLQLQQNFEEIMYAIKAIQNYINDNVIDKNEESADYLTSDAITYDAEEPV